MTFKGNKIKKFAKLGALWNEGLNLPWQAEGWWEGDDESSTAPVALLFGPQYGPLTGMALEEAMQHAPRHHYTEIVAAAFSFEPEASEIAVDGESQQRRHFVQGRPEGRGVATGLRAQQAGRIGRSRAHPRLQRRGPPLLAATPSRRGGK